MDQPGAGAERADDGGVRWPVVVVIVAVAAIVAILAVVAVGEDDVDLTSEGGGPTKEPTAGVWQEIEAPPFEPRTTAVAAWTGTELVVFGGDQFLCPPGADCAPSDESAFRDGASLDPATGAWRPIADTPVPVRWAATAVVDGLVYALGSSDYYGLSTLLLAYDPEADTWTELDPPDDESRLLVATGDRLVAYATSHEQRPIADLVYEPTTGAWTELPIDPLAPSFDRTVVWVDGAIHVLAKDLVDNPGSAEPSLVRAARLDLEAGTWEPLPDSESIGMWDPTVVGDLVVDPSSGGADGGSVNGWGRWYPNGGIYDAVARAWRALPAFTMSEPEPTGVIGPGVVSAEAPDAPLLDVTSMEWMRLPVLPDHRDGDRWNVFSAGDALVVVGGERWGGTAGEILTAAAIWRP